MLVLSRKLQQEILIGDNVKVTVLKVKGNTVRLGIEAPRSVRIVRGELAPLEEKMAEVTIVFDPQEGNNSLESDSNIVPNVVPFCPTDRQDVRSDRKNRSRLNPDNQASHSSISFKNRLPIALHHDRLQQIVTELSNKQ